jgi:FSR family fosmidomycin resistance protein-like MFS transporter
MFQVGGNFGSAIGPLAAAIFVVRYGQPSLRVFALLALISVTILWNVGVWYKHHGLERLKAGAKGHAHAPLPRGKAALGLAILVALIFSKFVYLASITSYFTFYLIHQFGASVQVAQLHLFLFLAAVAVGTVVGGPLGDKLGRKTVIWFSILGCLPFTLLLPHVDLFWTGPLAIVIGLILASAFPAIVVFAQELAPGNVGMVAGLCFGLSFGLGGIGAAVLGRVADLKGIAFVYQVCAWLPAIGLLAAFLPRVGKPKH